MANTLDLYDSIKAWFESEDDPDKRDIYKATSIEITPTKVIFKDSNGNELYSVDAVELGIDTAKEKLVEKIEEIVFKDSLDKIEDVVGNITSALDAAKAIDNMTKYEDPWDVNLNDIASAVAPFAGGVLGVYVGGACYIGNEVLQTGTKLIASHNVQILAYSMLCFGVNDESIKELEKYADILGMTPEELASSMRKEGYIDEYRLQDILNVYNENAKNARVKVDPVVLDLNGNNIVMTSISEGSNFDLNNDGFAEKTEWIEKEDGFLVRDLNKNGKIDNGSELIGDNQLLSNGELSKNGLEVLLDMDKNKDGYLDSKDAAFSELKVWRDLNGNGKTDSGELSSLSDLNINRIKLNDGITNDIEIGSIEMKDGTEKLMVDLFFTTNNIYSVEIDGDYEGGSGSNDYSEDVEISNEVKNLPQVIGTGTVVNLRKAMQLDVELRNMVKEYISNAGVESLELIDKILFRWCGSENINPSSRGSNIDARVLGVIEKFTGSKFNGVSGENPNTEAANILNTMYDEIKRYVSLELGLQSYLGEYLDLIQVKYNGKTNKTSYDLSELENFALTNKEQDKVAIAFKQISGIYKNNALLMPELENTINILKESSDEFKMVYDINKAITATSVNDTIRGTNGNDLIVGYGGDDKISGGAGNDTYIFRKGDGQDIIDNYYHHGNAENADNDILEMNGLKYSECELSMNGNDLIVKVKGTTDSVTIKNCFSSEYYRINSIKFADKTMSYDNIVDYFKTTGTVITGTSDDDRISSNILSWAKATIGGREGDDTINGSSGSEVIYAGSGNDTINAGSGNDTIYGQDGNDNINAGDGNDILDGGAGNDKLSGGAGNDRYIFKKGYGKDVIDNYCNYIDNDILEMRGLKYSECELAMAVTDLIVKVKGTNDSVTVKNCFSSEYHRINSIKFADKTMNYDDIVNYFKTTGTVVNGTASNDNILPNVLTWSKVTINGGAGDDTITGRAEIDILDGGAGNDKLSGGAGNDIYVFKKGYGQDIIDNYCNQNSDNDILEMRGLKYSECELSMNGTDLIVKVKGTNDSVTVKNCFSSECHRINSIKFTDKTMNYDNIVNYFKTTGTVVNGTASNDNILPNVLTWSKVTINGGAGDDTITGRAEIDILDGGAGNDKLSGGAGNDIYVFKKGYGQDIIDNYCNQNSDNDILEMRGLKYSECELAMAVTDLIVKVKGTNDSVTVKNCFSSEYHRINSIKFADKTMNYDDIVNYFKTTGTVVNGTASNDNISPNVLPWSKVTINGGAGDDTITGRAEIDILDGGAGNDKLSGGAGNDIYVFKKGYGQDIIDNYCNQNSDNDILEMRGLKYSECELSMNGSDLIVKVKGTTDSVTIKSCFASEYHRINSIKFTDETMNYNDIVNYFKTRGLKYSECELVMEGKDLIIKVKGTNDSVTVRNCFASEYERINSIKFEDKTMSYDNIVDYFKTTGTMISGTSDNDKISSNILSWAKATIDGREGDDIINGSDGKEIIYGGSGNDTIYGGSGNDTIYGQNGNDILDGGIGRDSLSGGAGNDIYIFKKGYGQDIINNYYKHGNSENADNDILEMSELKYSECELSMNGNDLVVKVKDTNDSVTVRNCFASEYYRINSIKFADKTMNYDNIVNYFKTTGTMISGTSDNDKISSNILSWAKATIDGREGDDIINGSNGKEIIYGGSGNDTIYGGSGNDTIYGQNGNDILDGGIGRDNLSGGAGNDIYIFKKGYGQDIINNYYKHGNSENADNDTLEMSELKQSQVNLNKEGNDLIISIKGTEDKVTIKNHYSSEYYRLNSLKFADGTIACDSSTGDFNLTNAVSMLKQTYCSTSSDELMSSTSSYSIEEQQDVVNLFVE